MVYFFRLFLPAAHVNPVGAEQKRKVEGWLRYYPLALVIMPQRQLRQFGRSYQAISKGTRS
jgi:hypothetical protein